LDPYSGKVDFLPPAKRWGQQKKRPFWPTSCPPARLPNPVIKQLHSGQSSSIIIMSTPAMRAFLASEKVNKKPSVVFTGFYKDKHATSNFMFADTEMPLKGESILTIIKIKCNLFFCNRHGCQDA
jgi:hypothetical protein